MKLWQGELKVFSLKDQENEKIKSKLSVLFIPDSSSIVYFCPSNSKVINITIDEKYVVRWLSLETYQAFYSLASSNGEDLLSEDFAGEYIAQDTDLNTVKDLEKKLKVYCIKYRLLATTLFRHCKAIICSCLALFSYFPEIDMLAPKHDLNVSIRPPHHSFYSLLDILKERTNYSFMASFLKTHIKQLNFIINRTFDGKEVFLWHMLKEIREIRSTLPTLNSKKMPKREEDSSDSSGYSSEYPSEYPYESSSSKNVKGKKGVEVSGGANNTLLKIADRIRRFLSSNNKEDQFLLGIIIIFFILLLGMLGRHMSGVKISPAF